MAGNKASTKNKGKEERSKPNKAITQTNEDIEEHDFSLLRKPIHTSITGFAQARKIFDWATEELKALLSNECDLLYECKVCRNMFRSLANFISHKRVYCQETFNASVHGHFINPRSAENEILRITRLEEGYQESLKERHGDNSISTDEVDERIPLTKDLTTIIEKIAKTKVTKEHNKDEQNVVLQKIPNSSIAVFQSVDVAEENNDKMRAQVIEIDDMLARDKAVLQSDGTFKTLSTTPADSESVIQISDDEDNDGSGSLKCKICDQQFSTQKTLKFHMKYKHLESRLVYPCPDCLEIFSTSWSVYRHLFKVHRKSAAQIRKLRESIQAKAFRMNNPPAFYEKRKNAKPAVTQKITEEERLDQENQAWMDNVEADGDTPRCFGCGRTFERRAALVSHTHTCQPRSRALARRPHETKKIEIQIRKDYNKGPPAALQPLLKTADSNENKIGNETTPIIQIKEETPVPTNQTNEQEIEVDILEDDTKSNDSSKSPDKTTEIKSQTDSKTIPKLHFAYQTEKSNLAAFKLKIQSDIELAKLLCKRCDSVYNNIQELYDHMAGHYKWLRYACKLCNFKSYDLEKVPEHVKVVHKLKGDTDFYFSTVKAIDGVEALELSESLEEINDSNGISPDSRRPSRCSSDSSRLSDESCSSTTRIEGSRKRKIQYTKSTSKRKKESFDDDDDSKVGDTSLDKDMLVDNDSSLISKTFEENSSDVDDIDDKISKKQITDNIAPVASRRPVRKKTKPKNEDFEYDLSNLLKMEAQGYRDSQAVTNTKSNQNKKKVSPTDNANFYDNINKDCCGALATLSKKSVDNATAHMKSISFLLQKVQKESNMFVRPLLPKIVSRSEKTSPKKDIVDDSKDTPCPHKDTVTLKEKESTEEDSIHPENNKNKTPTADTESVSNSNNNKQEKPAAPNTSAGLGETSKPSRIPAVVPIKFRRQSLDVIKNNPIINKNITDFTKAGMKTKILVIKPINRSKDGASSGNTTLKFQTIKIKDPSKASSSKELNSDQVVLVKVPNVERATSRSVTDSVSVNSGKTSPNDSTKVNDIATDAVNPIAGEVCDPVNISTDNCNSDNNRLQCVSNHNKSSKSDNSEINDRDSDLPMTVNKAADILPVSKTVETSV